MRSPLPRLMALSTAAALTLSILSAVPAVGEEEGPARPAGEDSQSEELDALALAEQTGEPVEIPSLTDEKTQHFANPDGTLTAEISAIPARVRSADGWVDVDTTLIATDDGSVRPKAAGMDIAFSDGGDAPMARIEIGSNSVELGWHDDLPTPTLDGNQATYTDVLPDVDLVLTAGVEGFTQVLVVHTPEAAASEELAELELALDTTGVEVTADEHGNIEAVGEKGGQGVFTVQAPEMWDSTGQEEAPGEDPSVGPTTGAQTAMIETEVDVDSIQLVPDQEMLTSEETEYPVYIDPSVSANRPNWAYVDRAYPNQTYYNRNIDSVGVGRYSDPTGTYTRRALFQFTMMARTNHPNTIINSATLRTEVDWAHDCNSNSYVQLHRVDAFNSRTTWNAQPTARTLQDTQNVSGGWATCPASSGVEFDATNAYEWGLDNNASHIYLRLKERNESSNTAWRRFDVDNRPPVLVVNYNHPPEKPVTSTISDSLGGVCQTDRTEPRLINNTEVAFQAQIRDRDSYWVGQQVKAQFEWKLTGVDDRLGTSDSAYVTVGKWSGGSYRSVTAQDLPEKELIAYRVRGHDQQDWGPWSDWCFIEIDTTKPDSGPEVVSADYPAGEEVHGSVGRTGDFTFTNNGVEDAVAYHYSVNDASCSTTVELDEPGAEATVPITPRRDGPNLVHARSSDAYGNSSECGLVYTFTVAPAAGPVSHFPLDEGQGTTATDVRDSDRVATTDSGVEWVRGRVGENSGQSYRLEGTAVATEDSGHLRTEDPVIDTSGAFSVSAWVRLDEATTNHTAVSQDGDRHSGFYLGYNNTSEGNWVFKQAPFDGDDTNIARRVYSSEPAELGVWTHLLGTHDPETGELVLYVDGVRQGEVIQESPWNAEGPLVIGGAKYRGQFYDAWPGAIDDVHVWDRVVTDDVMVEDVETHSEVWELANRPAALEGRWRLDETEGTVVTDSSDHDLDGTLHADPLTAWNNAINDVTFAPGVSLDAAEEEHIRTADPAVRADRSYSVAAWVRLDEVGHNATAVSQDGDDHSAFYLSYQHSYDWDNWVMKIPPEDETGATGWYRALSDHAPEFGRWTHLAATYDHTRREATLYIDGVAHGTAEISTAWHANGPVVIGGGLFEQQFSDPWLGDISDVHLYQGVLSEDDLTLIRMGLLPTT